MTELLTLDLTSKNLVTSQLVLTIGYDIENLIDPEISKNYNGEVTIDRYGRKIPKHAHGTVNIDHKTSSTKTIMEAVMQLYDRIVNPNLLTRRINITANNVINKDKAKEEKQFEQIDLFGNYIKKEENTKKEESESKIQKAMLDIKNKYGKNAIIKGMNLQEGGTTIDRNKQIGGHKS